MVWVFRDGVQLSKKAPDGTYVYRWSHLGIPRYVGVGKSHRWLAHLDGAQDVNPEKAIYFIQHRAELSCEIVKEGLSKKDAHCLEAELIREHGLIKNGGILLNMMTGASAPVPTGRGTPFSKRLYFALMKLPPFASSATITVLSPTNPKRLNSGGRKNFELYPSQGCSVLVGEHNKLSKDHGYSSRSQHGHLCWDVAHRFISISLLAGEVAPVGTTVPTEDFMRQLEAGLDTPAKLQSPLR
jgi:hypothetical protein